MAKRTLLDNRHPDYLRLSADWCFWRQSYEGGNAYRNAGHLFRFPRETQASYAERVKRSGRMNFTRQVLDLLIQYLGKEVPVRQTETASDPLKRFWSNVDRHGASINDFMKSVGLMTALYGQYYLLVDKPPEIASTQWQQDAARLQPYVYGISPLDVLDWVQDETTGEISQALIREYVRGPVTLTESRDQDALQVRFRLWLKTTEGVLWVLFTQDAEGQPVEIGQGLVSIPRIPLISVTRTGGSMAEDIAPLDRKVFNYESLLDQILYDQTFSTLRLPWTGSTEAFYEKWELTLGTKSILPYDPASGAAPDFIAPDASQGELILKAIEQTVNRIYQMKSLLDTVGNTQLSSPNAASGIARGYDFEKLNAGLAAFADDLERAEKQLATLVNLWEGVDAPINDDLIDYPDTFDVKTLLQELEETRQLSQAIPSTTFRQSLQMRLIRKAAPKLTEQQIQQMSVELDNPAGASESSGPDENRPGSSR